MCVLYYCHIHSCCSISDSITTFEIQQGSPYNKCKHFAHNCSVALTHFWTILNVFNDQNLLQWY